MTLLLTKDERPAVLEHTRTRLALSLAGIGAAVVLYLLVPAAAIAALAVVIAAFIALRLEFALFALLAVLYSRIADGLSQTGIAPSLASLIGKGLIAFVLVVVVVRRLAADEPLANVRLMVGILATYGCLLVGSLWYAADGETVRNNVSDFIRDGAVALLIVALITDAHRLRVAVWGVITACGVLAGASVLQQITGNFDSVYLGLAQSQVEHIVGEVTQPRSGGPGLGANGFAQILLVGYPLAIERAVHELRRGVRVLAGCAAALIFVAIIFTFSRNVFIAMALISVLLVVLLGLPVRSIVGALLVAVLAVGVVAPETYLDRVATLADLIPGVGEDSTEEVSYRGRLSEYIVAVQMFGDHPIVGVGSGNYNEHYLEYSGPLGLDPRREDRSPHSMYLEFAAEFGLFGILWLIGILSVVWRRLSGARGRLAHNGQTTGLVIGVQLALVSFLTTGLFRHLAVPRYFWIVLALAVATPAVVSRRADEPTADRS